MSPATPEITSAQLDRLVDGELSSNERRELLAALEAQHNGWRRCALAFLEAQSWRGGFRQFILPARSEAEAPLVTCPEEAPAVDPRVTPRGACRPAGKSVSRAGRGSQWLGIAAAMLVAFTLGRQLRTADLQNDGAAVAGVKELAGPQTAHPRHEDLPAPPAGDAVTLVVNDHAGRPQRIRVPLVEGRDLGEEFADVPGWTATPQLARELDQRGLGLAARRRYAPLYFEQQNERIPMIVPVDDAVITPVSRPVF